jgi:hypothetical protein
MVIMKNSTIFNKEKSKNPLFYIKGHNRQALLVIALLFLVVLATQLLFLALLFTAFLFLAVLATLLLFLTLIATALILAALPFGQKDLWPVLPP